MSSILWTGRLEISLELAARGKSGELADLSVFSELLNLLKKWQVEPEKFDLYDDVDSKKKGVRYTEADFLDMLKHSDKHAAPFLYNRKSFAFEFYVGYLMNRRISPVITFDKWAFLDLGRAFNFCDALCSLFEPAYAALAFDWPGDSPEANEFNAMLRSRVVHRYGFDSIAIRTYIGPELLNMFDLSDLEALNLDIMPTSWGGIRIDLIKDPWAASFEDLYQQMKKVNSYLDDKGLRGDYSRALFKKSGRNWLPIKDVSLKAN